MNLNRHRRLAVFAAALSVSAIAPVWGQSAPSLAPPQPQAIGEAQPSGKPSEEHRVSFEGTNDGNEVIQTVKVKPGDVVHVGDVLMEEDTAEAKAQLDVLAAAAAATGAIDEAEATIEAKTKLVDQYKGLSEGNSSAVELINAQMDLDVAKAKKQQATEDQQQRKLEYERQKIKLDHMILRSPVNGIVRKVGLFEGEVMDPNRAKDGAVYIVSNDPLWVEMELGAERAAKLHLHDKVDVAFADAPTQWRTGEVIFLDPAVEFASQTEVVRISVANPDNRPSGLPMMVKLPDGIVGSPATALGSAQ
jgi:multidrug efflux pump subunit AcrA (membrane-fusion protein)